MNDHYEFVRHWFSVNDETRLRGINTDYGYLLYANYILSSINAPLSSTVLEIGCGDGAVMAKIREIRPDLKVFGLDISQIQIDQSVQNNPGINFKVANALEGNPFSMTFDRIVSFSTAQYFPHLDLVQMIRTWVSQLDEDDGQFVSCSIPDIKKKSLRQLEESYSENKRFGYFDAVKLIRTIRKNENLVNEYFNRSDGSFWHNAEALQNDLKEQVDCNIIRPSDSWYRFDLKARKRK